MPTYKHINKSKPETENVKAGRSGISLEDNRAKAVVMRKANNTGLPDQLKSGIESLSGYSMDDVKVHYNSSKPSQLQAHAYAQGNNIHVASGQEKYLAHEAWHVVQQKQGRVKPTTQVNGVHVNDSSHLEKEADVMGDKAIQKKEAPVHQLKSSEGQPVAQLGIAKPPKKKRLSLAEERRKKEREYLFRPWKRYDDELEQIKRSVKGGELELKLLKDRVEDDDDVKLLNEYSFDLKRILIDARATRRKIRNKPLGRTRSQDSGQKDLIGRLNGYKYHVYLLLQEVKKLFPSHSGGFGAKGRAHKMTVAINPDSAPDGGIEDGSFVNSFALNGVASNAKVYKKDSKKVAKESAKGVTIMGHSPTGPVDKDAVLVELEKRLDAINSPQEVAYKGPPVGMGRGKGQYANMANTNATGYAYLLNVPGWQSQRWEWLHIRGAGLGGATNSTNLVTGTRDANTHMIPFESNIRVLASAVQMNRRYSSLQVKWSVSGQKAHHAFTGIQIEWRLVPADAGAKSIYGIARFNPLVTGSNISKAEVQHIEDALKTVRDTMST